MSTITKTSPGICYHCGADEGIHEFETMRCPKNGIEETRDGIKQVWLNTTFENRDWRMIADKGPEMLAVLQQCAGLVGDLRVKQFIRPISGENQDMIQRITAMEPRIVNTIKSLLNIKL